MPFMPSGLELLVANSDITVRLGYHPPYDARSMLGFLHDRAIAGLEWVDPQAGTVARTLRLDAGDAQGRWLVCQFDESQCEVQLHLDAALARHLPRVMAMVRAWLDLDADPVVIDAVLADDFPFGNDLRVPGTLDGFELAVRAVIGQQVTVAAARTLVTRLVERFGEPLATPAAGLARLFPGPRTLALASGDALGQLGIVRQRQAAIQALARATLSGELTLHPGADPVQTMATLRTIPGIGDWTAQYIAMRALRWPDAFPAGDVALQKALGVRGERHPARAALQQAERWRPWRSYAVMRAWHALA